MVNSTQNIASIGMLAHTKTPGSFVGVLCSLEASPGV
jgi:hypothetical protein